MTTKSERRTSSVLMRFVGTPFGDRPAVDLDRSVCPQRVLRVVRWLLSVGCCPSLRARDILAEMRNSPAMESSPVFSLEQNPAHLGLGATVICEPRFTGDWDWYKSYGERHQSDGVEGRLVSMYTFSKPWETWEMHPKGAELVLCTDGELTLHQELGGQVRTVKLRKGEAVINPCGVWHTADCDAPCTVLFITAGEGTEIRSRT